MKIVICGGGHVGLSIAQYLGEEYDITLIDNSPAVLAEASEKVDLQTVLGNAADPEVLERAGIENAGILIAVTATDEVNVVACQMAQSIFNVRMKIARLRSPHYAKSGWSDAYRKHYLPIDVVISPEEEVAAAITQHLQVPFAFEVLSIANGQLQVLGITIPAKSPVLFTPLKHLEGLFPGLQMSVLRIFRHKEMFIPSENDEIFPGDEIYFLLPKKHVNRLTEAIGYKDEANQRILILGGGRVGLRLAEEIERAYPSVSSTLIEAQKSQTRHLVSQLTHTLVLQGDALDSHILQEAGIENIDTVVAVTNDDKVNILGSLLAKRCGARRAVTLVNRRGYMSLMVSLGIDKILSPSTLTISLILQRVRKGYIHMVHSLGERVGEIMEIEVHPTAYAMGLPVQELHTKKEMRIFAVIRQGKIIFPPPEFILQAYDHVIVATMKDCYKKLRRFFEPRVDTIS